MNEIVLVVVVLVIVVVIIVVVVLVVDGHVRPLYVMWLKGNFFELIHPSSNHHDLEVNVQTNFVSLVIHRL